MALRRIMTYLCSFVRRDRCNSSDPWYFEQGVVWSFYCSRVHQIKHKWWMLTVKDVELLRERVVDMTMSDTIAVLELQKKLLYSDWIVWCLNYMRQYAKFGIVNYWDNQIIKVSSLQSQYTKTLFRNRQMVGHEHKERLLRTYGLGVDMLECLVKRLFSLLS